MQSASVSPLANETDSVPPCPSVGRSLAGIFGHGRCGSTWLGAIVSSHPDVAYRFEPFGRLQRRLGRLPVMQASEMGPRTLPALYDLLLSAYPEVEKPPFFPKNYAMRATAGRSVLWPLARRSAICGDLFRWMYTPRGRPPIVFKAVAKEDRFVALASRSDVPLVYLLRHPCATVESILRGQRHGWLGQGRLKIASALIKNHAPKLFDQFGDQIGSMTPLEKETLIWRAMQEHCYRVIQQCPGVHLVFYEQLCRQPVDTAAAVLAHFGLSMDDQVCAFIRASTSRQRGWRLGAWWGNSFFNIFRGTRITSDAWRDRLTSHERQRIIELVKDSPVFQLGKQLARWSE